MTIIKFIRSIIEQNESIPYHLRFVIDDKEVSFFEGINIIDCNKKLNIPYRIVNTNEGKVFSLDERNSIFKLVDALENHINEKPIKYRYFMDDKTKAIYYISINISPYNFEEYFNKIKSLPMPSNSLYVFGSFENFRSIHYYNNYFKEHFRYNQNLIQDDLPVTNKKEENYIIIKLCHDLIQITSNKISFTKYDTYDIIQMILPCLNISKSNAFIEFTPEDIKFSYPISINFQLFDTMLCSYDLHSYLHVDEANRLIGNQTNLIYKIKIYNIWLEMNIYSESDPHTEIVEFQNLEWYMYASVKIIMNYLYLLYVNFHIQWELENNLSTLKVPLKINYNRLFGKYYTRHFNNSDKVLPVCADKEYCEKKNIKCLQWNDNYYMAPEGTGYTIVFVYKKKFLSNDTMAIPKCVKIVRKSTGIKRTPYTNISYELDPNSKGKFPTKLFISNGYELFDLFRNYLNTEDDPSIQFGMCPCGKTYINIPNQLNIIKFMKRKVKMLFHSNNQNDGPLDFNQNDIKKLKEFTSDEEEQVKINVLAFSVNDKSEVFPYAVKNFVYNYNSNYPFIIIMLNTSKKYTLPNYRYEYIATETSKLFYMRDKCVQALFSLYQKYQISLIDNFVFEESKFQYIGENELTVLIAEKSIPNKNCYLWRSIYSNRLPNVPTIDPNDFNETLPTLSDLHHNIKNINAYHYIRKNNSTIIIYGVWADDIYYPCIITKQSKIPEFPNIPYFLINRDPVDILNPDISDYIFL